MQDVDSKGNTRLRIAAKGPADERHLSNCLDSASLLEMGFVFTGD